MTTAKLYRLHALYIFFNRGGSTKSFYILNYKSWKVNAWKYDVFKVFIIMKNALVEKMKLRIGQSNN